MMNNDNYYDELEDEEFIESALSNSHRIQHYSARHKKELIENNKKFISSQDDTRGNFTFSYNVRGQNKYWDIRSYVQNKWS